jgi:hypothetical protein
MKSSLIIAAVVAFNVTVMASCSDARTSAAIRLHAQLREQQQVITPNQQRASDQLMSSGLTQLQQAASSLQLGAFANTVGNLQSAISDMHQAEPIYDGYRVASMRKARRAVALLSGRRVFPERASAFVNAAITDAQTALAHSGLEINEKAGDETGQ